MLRLFPPSPTSPPAGRRPFDVLLAHHTRLAAHALRARSSFLALAGDDGELVVQHAYAPGVTDSPPAVGAAAIYESVAREGGVVTASGGRGRNGSAEGEAPAYAAAPVGSGRGVVAVFDTRPRRWTRHEIGILREIAGAVDEICRSRAGSEPEEAHLGTPAVFGDAGERYLAQERLRRQEEHFRSLIENAADIVHVVDATGRIRYISPSVERILGYSPEELVGKPGQEFVHPEDLPAGMRALARDVRRPGTIRELELRLRHRDGRWRTFQVVGRAVRDQEGEPVVIVNSHDVTDRKRVEEALRESEARYRALFEKTPVGVVHFGPDLRITDCNERMVELSGLPLERLVGFQLSGLRDQRVLHPFRQALAGEPAAYHGPYLTPGGAEWHVAVQVSPLRDPAGRSLGGVAVVQNVTERHGAEVELRQKEALYRLLVENASDIIYRTDARGVFTYVNSVAVRATGYPEAELLEMHYLELVRPDFREAAERFYRRQLQERIPSTYFEFVITGRDGRDIWIGQNVELLTEEDGVEGMQAVARNISDQKWAEAALDETLARERAARRLAETTQRRAALLAYVSEFLDGSFEILESDREGRLAELAYLVADTVAHSCSVHETRNGEAPTLLAHTRVDPWTRKVSTEEETPGHFEAERRLAQRVMETARPLLVSDLDEDAALPPDAAPAGELREAGFRSLMVVPMIARGRVLGAIVLAGATPELRYEREDLLFAQDLGRRIAIALDNARLYVEAERAARVRDELLAIVSHDLRNPLNVLSIGVNDLRRGGPVPLPPAAERRQLDILAHSVERMNRLVRDLLDVARVESGSLAVDLTEYRTDALVQEAVEAHLPLAREKGVLLRLSLPEELPAVLADGDRILQVFSNLLGNAVRFTPESGTVTVGAEARGDEVVFGVTDTGPGIPAEEIPRVFDRFWQAKRARRAGAGLGLAISRGIVEAHGGRIWVESRVGEGSTFTFALPRPAAEPGG